MGTNIIIDSILANFSDLTIDINNEHENEQNETIVSFSSSKDNWSVILGQ